MGSDEEEEDEEDEEDEAAPFLACTARPGLPAAKTRTVRRSGQTVQPRGRRTQAIDAERARGRARTSWATPRAGGHAGWHQEDAETAAGSRGAGERRYRRWRRVKGEPSPAGRPPPRGRTGGGARSAGGGAPKGGAAPPGRSGQPMAATRRERCTGRGARRRQAGWPADGRHTELLAGRAPRAGLSPSSARRRSKNRAGTEVGSSVRLDLLLLRCTARVEGGGAGRSPGPGAVDSHAPWEAQGERPAVAGSVQGRPWVCGMRAASPAAVDRCPSEGRPAGSAAK
ncbi:unnamed protein product [Prorocentrum cordatum]|uniref:Uncharacterized protein n=1 Tax=Prorocentrum cordatum TaxID=2364126 RepID=A0ABN9UNE4_9DINO|nr:unnamed protein product [Polarella glacialis]